MADKDLTPRPRDFRKQARTLSSVELQAHYGVSQPLIQRWCKELKITLMRYCQACREKRQPNEFSSPRAMKCEHCESLEEHYSPAHWFISAPLTRAGMRAFVARFLWSE